MGLKSVRSFDRQESKKKLGNLLIIACTIFSLCILSLVKAHFYPIPYGKLHGGSKLEILEVARTEDGVENSSILEDEDEDPINPICYESGTRSDTCIAQGDVRVQGRSKSIFINPFSSSQQHKIKPYAHKTNPAALSYTKEWSLAPFSQNPPQCTDSHASPAIVFSIGGFTGNVFHDFTDVIIPLFITSRRFRGEVHFLVADTKTWWLHKYAAILKHLTNYAIIDTEINAEENTVHCFPKAIVGPTYHKVLGIDATKTPNRTMSDFQELLKNALGLSRDAASRGSTRPLSEGGLKLPRLLIVSRKGSRAFLNAKAMVSMATSIGFDVRIGEPDAGTDLAKFARLVNSADVMIGVHGAGLTNMVFLPRGAVVIQVVPLGGLEYLARDSFMEPAEDMGLKYVEYVIGEEESSLVEQYPRDDPVFRDPASVHNQGWDKLKEVYLDKQNVRPHLGKLRDTLLEAIKILPH